MERMERFKVVLDCERADAGKTIVIRALLLEPDDGTLLRSRVVTYCTNEGRYFSFQFGDAVLGLLGPEYDANKAETSTHG